MRLNEVSPESALTSSYVFDLETHKITHNALKRAFDIVFSLSVLILGAPLFLCIALLVKLTSAGPIFYCSLRIGRQGQLFKFWKFRSMHRDADERLTELLQSSLQLRQEWNTYFKLKQDPRLTRSESSSARPLSMRSPILECLGRQFKRGRTSPLSTERARDHLHCDRGRDRDAPLYPPRTYRIMADLWSQFSHIQTKGCPRSAIRQRALFSL